MFFVYEGHRIFYTDRGEGDVLLFVHGLGGSSLNWAYQVQYFSKSRRVVCIDLPGHGQSEGKSIPFAEFEKVVGSLLDHLQLRSCAICGLTMGARVAMGTAARSPGRISALVMVNALLTLAPDDKAARFQLYDELLRGEEGLKTWALELLSQMAVPVGTTIHRGFMRSLDAIDPLHLRSLLVDSLEMDQREQACRVGSPTLLIRGDTDALVPRYCQLELQSLIRQSRIETMEECGHLPYLEAPVRFNTLVEGFCTSNTAL